MAYTTPYTPTQPLGTDPAKDAPLDMREKEAMMVERIEDLFGTDFTDDPMEVTQFGHTGVVVSNGKVVYEAEYDAGNSGATKTIDIANGTTQKITMTANCVFTIATPPAGATIKLNIVQNGTGGWTFTFGGNVNYQSDIAPVLITTANTSSILQGYSNGTVIFLTSAGTGYSVS